MSKTIALAEDDSDDQLLFSEALKQVCRNSKLTAVHSGMLLLDMLEESRNSLPDVIVLDVNMPGMSGIECLKILRKTHGFDHLPVIIMSTSASPQTINDAFDHGANSYAVKPGKFDDLRSIVKEIIVTDWALQPARDRMNFLMKPNSAIR